MKAIVFERFGDPREVLQVVERPVPEPGSGEVRVRMRAVPINPSDLLVVRGQYGALPALPATPGFEGVGIIDASNGGLLARLRGLKPGRRVAVLNGRGGNWAEYVVLSARQVVPVPDDLPDDQVAAFFVNPATALVMTQRVLHVARGTWLLQTAASSALGRMIIRLGKAHGFRTINVVRNPQRHAAGGNRSLADELKQLGADEVLSSTEPGLKQRVHDITHGSMLSYALDAVGGPFAAEVVQCLSRQGRLLVYGTLSGEPIPLDPRTLMVGQKAIEGFWLSEWVKQQNALGMLKLFRQITTLMRSGVLTSPIEAAFTLDQLPQAIERAQESGRSGKILLRFL
jgi:NADPH:quinone reductase-like Zn-dependent oxidoreductase